MRLSLQTDYALRILMFLAASDRRVSVEEIARAFDVSGNHLVKVAHRLTQLKLLDAKRGRGGGIALARPPSSINVGIVVRKMENLSNFVQCLDEVQNRCRISRVCGLQGALSLAVEDFLKRLDRYQIADLMSQKERSRSKVMSCA